MAEKHALDAPRPTNSRKTLRNTGKMLPPLGHDVASANELPIKLRNVAPVQMNRSNCSLQRPRRSTRSMACAACGRQSKQQHAHATHCTADNTSKTGAGQAKDGYQEQARQLCKRDEENGEVDGGLVSSDGARDFRGDKGEAIVGPHIDAPNEEQLERLKEHGPVCDTRAQVNELNAAENFENRSGGDAAPSLLRRQQRDFGGQRHAIFCCNFLK